MQLSINLNHTRKRGKKLLAPLISRQTERAQISEAYDGLINSDVPDGLAALEHFNKTRLLVFKRLMVWQMAMQQEFW